jgi:hypothetical protein
MTSQGDETKTIREGAKRPFPLFKLQLTEYPLSCAHFFLCKKACPLTHTRLSLISSALQPLLKGHTAFSNTRLKPAASLP